MVILFSLVLVWFSLMPLGDAVLPVCTAETEITLHEKGYVVVNGEPVSLLDLTVTDIEVITAPDGSELVLVIANDHLVGFYAETSELFALSDYPKVFAADVLFNDSEAILLYTPFSEEHRDEIWANGEALIKLDRPRETIVDLDVQVITERSLTEIRPAVLGVTQRMVVLTTEGVAITYDLTINDVGEIEAERRITFDDRLYVLVDILKTGNLNIVYQGQTSVRGPSKSNQSAIIEIDQEKKVPYLPEGRRVYQIYQGYVVYSHPYPSLNLLGERIFYTDTVVKALIVAGVWNEPGCTSITQ